MQSLNLLPLSKTCNFSLSDCPPPPPQSSRYQNWTTKESLDSGKGTLSGKLSASSNDSLNDNNHMANDFINDAGCNSPPATMVHQNRRADLNISSVDLMPTLKRALQAPPVAHLTSASAAFTPDKHSMVINKELSSVREKHLAVASLLERQTASTSTHAAAAISAANSNLLECYRNSLNNPYANLGTAFVAGGRYSAPVSNPNSWGLNAASNALAAQALFINSRSAAAQLLGVSSDLLNIQNGSTTNGHYAFSHESSPSANGSPRRSPPTASSAAMTAAVVNSVIMSSSVSSSSSSAAVETIRKPKSTSSSPKRTYDVLDDDGSGSDDQPLNLSKKPAICASEIIRSPLIQSTSNR